MIQNSTPQPLQFSPTSPSFSMAPWPPMAALCPRARRCRSRCRGSPNRCQDHGHCPGADLGGSDLRPRDHSEGNPDRFKSKICRKRSEIQQIQQPEMSLYTRRIHSELPMFYFETFMIYHINPYHTYIVISYYSKTSSMIYYPESNYFSILFYIFFLHPFLHHILSSWFMTPLCLPRRLSATPLAPLSGWCRWSDWDWTRSWRSKPANFTTRNRVQLSVEVVNTRN